MQWFARLCCVKQASNWGWKSHVEVGDEESRLPTRLGQPHQVPGHDEKRPAMHAAGDDKRRPLLLRRSWCVRTCCQTRIEDPNAEVSAVSITKKNQMIDIKLCTGGRGKQLEKLWER
jgi:hypothetical protein